MVEHEGASAAGRTGQPPTSDLRSLREHAYERLREDIVQGTLSPGSRLVEREVAERLGVSRITVREAFHQLESEGLIVKQARRGVVVTELTHSDVRDLFEVMESLEVLAARLAAERRSRSDLRILASLLDVARDALAAGDDRRGAATNAEFHSRIVDAANNELLHATMKPLNSRVQRVFVASREVTDLDRMLEEHTQLYRAIEAGDAELAADLTRRHLQESRRPTLKLVLEQH